MKRILLMDDEQIVLDLLTQMFSHLGYNVAACTDGIKATDLYTKAKADGAPFDLVMLDLVNLQGLGGPETAVKIREIDPAARIIATSGHLDHPVMLDHKKFGFDAAIEKPYKLEKLQEIADALTR